jgi:transcriptional regulator with XRE-family HTH domain
MTHSERITRLRRLAHVTQYQLAVLTGINSAFISMFENGLRPLTGDQIDLVERVLNDRIQAKAAEARNLMERNSRAAV